MVFILNNEMSLDRIFILDTLKLEIGVIHRAPELPKATRCPVAPNRVAFGDSGSGHSLSSIMFYVYVLRSTKDLNEIYVGYTTNLKRRFSLHQKGLVPSTKPYRPWKLIFYEAYINKVDAKRREEYLKTAKGKRALKLILQDTLNF